MASEKQIAANRQNSKKSTGPRTEAGKQRARQNAFRHGLTAQTVIRHVESAEAYTELESLVIADYEPQTTIERVLVERLASLLWRLRRAVSIETGLFQAEAPNFSGPREISPFRTTTPCEMPTDPIQMFRDILHQNKPVRSDRKSSKRKRPPREPPIQDPPNQEPSSQEPSNHELQGRNPTKTNIDAVPIINQTNEIIRCTTLSQRFLRLANTESGILERIERYEVSLWRQAAQTMLMLNSMQARL